MQCSFLKLHPDTRSPQVASIQVAIARLPAGGLGLNFDLVGDLAGLRIPETVPAARAEGLWRHTCFEAFISVEGGAYREFNFSPSGQWQAYEFAGYRDGGLLAFAVDPRITAERQAATLRLQATIDADDLPPGSTSRRRLGLSAVIEAADGAISYWALRHAPGKPDFHHPDTFALELFPCP